jgi:hypothetical protein
MVFGNKIVQVWRIYLAACAAAQLEVLLLNSSTEECQFFLTYCIQTLQSMYIVTRWPQQFCSQRDSIVVETPC